MATIIQFNETGGTEVLKFVEQEVPAPAPGEVQVEVKAAGLNRAELGFFQGTYLVQPNLPGSLLGFEGAGIIRDIGEGVTGWSVGDKVAVTPAFEQNKYGMLGEVANVTASSLEPIPEGVSFNEAAAFWMAFPTAYGLLVNKGGFRPGAGQTAVLNAASSSVGTSAFQLVKAFGGVSIALTRGPSKVDRLKAAGADHVIVTSEEDTVSRILEITNGEGATTICDAVGGSDQAALCNAAAFEGVVTQYGGLSGEMASTPLEAMFGKGVSLSAFHVIWHLFNVPERRRAAVEHLVAGQRDGVYSPLIDRTFAFGQTREAYEYMAANDQFGKIVVELA